MIAINTKDTTQYDTNLKFVSYTPVNHWAFCCGTLIVEYNGELIHFNGENAFWHRVCIPEETYSYIKDSWWIFDENKIPWYINAEELIQLFKDNVEDDCCGGCL